MRMEMGVTKDGIGRDQEWDVNGEKDMADCSLLYQPMAVRTVVGKNGTCLLSTTNAHYYYSHFYCS